MLDEKEQWLAALKPGDVVYYLPEDRDCGDPIDDIDTAMVVVSVFVKGVEELRCVYLRGVDVETSVPFYPLTRRGEPLVFPSQSAAIFAWADKERAYAVKMRQYADQLRGFAEGLYSRGC